MPGTGLPKVSKRKLKSRKKNQKRQRQLTLLIWSSLLGLAVIAVMGGVFGLWLLPKMNQSATQSSHTNGSAEPPDRLASRFPSPTESEALEMVKSALALRNPLAVASYFRPGGSTPQQVVDFLQELDATEGPITRFAWLSSIDANRLSIDGVLVSLNGKENPTTRLALLTPDAVGVWKIDFDALARTVTPSWDDFLDHTTESAQVRVFVARDSYYNGPFKDDNKWVCYGITSPDREEIFYGYCRRDTAQHAAMEALFVRETQMIRATLKIQYHEAAGPRQFVISRILAEDWAMGETDFDVSFD